jgi:hypothetical protein
MGVTVHYNRSSTWKLLLGWVHYRWRFETIGQLRNAEDRQATGVQSVNSWLVRITGQAKVHGPAAGDCPRIRQGRGSFDHARQVRLALLNGSATLSLATRTVGI